MAKKISYDWVPVLSRDPNSGRTFLNILEKSTQLRSKMLGRLGPRAARSRSRSLSYCIFAI